MFTSMLRDITNSIEDAVLAFAVPSDGSNISDSDRAYVLESAKTVPGFTTYAPFAEGTSATAAKAFNDQFLQSTVLLLPDTYDAGFRTAFEQVTEQEYNYKQNIESAAGAGVDSFGAIRSMQFLETAREPIAIVPNEQAVFTIAAPGKYRMNLDALWYGGSKKANILAAFVDKGSTFVSLESMDAQNSPQTTYVDNPLLYMSFDGITGATTGSAATPRTFGLGSASTLANNATALNLNGKVAIATGEGASVTSYIDKSGTTAWANRIAAFTQKKQRPALFGLQKAGDNWSIDFAPNRPAPVQVNLFAEDVPIYQYIIADAILAQTTGTYNYDPALVTWLDCRNPVAEFFTANTVSSGNALSCNPSRAGDFVLNGNALGTDAKFIGLALLPPGQIPLYMYPICADSSAQVQNTKGQKGLLSTTNPSNQLSQIELSSAIAAPESLQQMLDLVKNGTACATINREQLDIIWNLASTQVVPSALQCQASGSSGSIVPQSNSSNTPTPAPAPAPASGGS